MTAKEPLRYSASCSSTNEFAECPAVAEYEIDEETARQIIILAGVVKTHGLVEVQKFDYRPLWLMVDPSEDAEDDESDATDEVRPAKDDEENRMRSECDCLNVSDDAFWFTCFPKYGDNEIRCEEQLISDLVEHFGLTGVEPMQSVADHDFKPPRLTARYAAKAFGLWLAGNITFKTLMWALKNHPAALAGKGGSYIVDADAEKAFSGAD